MRTPRLNRMATSIGDSMSSYFNKYGDSSGGPLNDICERFRLATRKRSIPVIALQTKHKIVSPEHLLSEIDRHYHEECSCGLKGASTIEMLADSLFEAQEREWSVEHLKTKGDEKWDRETCLRWMQNLMGKNSFRGKHMEDVAIAELKKHVWKYAVEKSDEKTDVENAVDILILDGEKIVAGIQVKPDSFYNMGILYVAELNRKLDYPVHDLIYDSEGNWTNFLSTISHFL